MTESARLRLLAVTCEVCSRFLGPGTSITPGQRVRHAAKQTLVLDLLSVPLSLRLPGLFFGSAGPCLLCRFLLGVSLPLLRPAFFLLGLITGECAEGFFGLALGLVVHSYTSPSTALQDVRLLVRGADHVPDGDAALGSGALHLGEVHSQLLSLLLGGLRSVRLLLSALLLAAAGLLGSLARRLLSLLGCLTGGLLSLLSCLTGGVLRLLGRLSCLVCHLTGGLLGLASNLSCLVGRLTRGLLGLVCRLSGRVLRLTCDLPDLIGHSLEGTSASLVPAATGNSANGFLSLACDLSRLVGRLTCDLSGLICGLPGGLLGLVCRLARDLLSLVGRLTGGLLCLLGSTLRKLLHLLLGLLDGLVRYLYDALLLSCLIHRVFEFHVGVDHLLDLGLRVALGELLRVLLQLGAVVPDLAPEAAHGPPVEVLGVLHRLLLQLLLKIL
jgi:hypothetical protein